VAALNSKALVFSALSLGTGSGLRAQYLNEALNRLGHSSRLVAPGMGPLPYSAEFMLTAPRYALAGARAANVAVGVKPYPNVWMGLAMARLRGAVTVVDVDDDDGGYRGGFLGGVTKALQAPAFKLARFASTHHPLLKEKLVRRLGAARVLDLPQGVDTHRFHDGFKRIRHPHPVLGFAAHLNVACQLDVLLKAVGPWLKKHPRAVLLVAGGGPGQAHFERLAAPLGKQVRFLGSMPPEGIAAAMAGCDVGLSAYSDNPANRYRVPMKVAEYLALGLPVVTNMVPGLAPLRPYVYDAEPAAFGPALDKALKTGRARALKGQAFVRRTLSWDTVAKNFLKQLHARMDA
jgi:glycosyltransferase involved in cell wall biosynthesis